MKFYETEIPVTATDVEGDVDRSRIVPVATGAEPYRGLKIFDAMDSDICLCCTRTKLQSHQRQNFKMLKIIAF